MTARQPGPAAPGPPRPAASVLADRLAAHITGHEPGWRLPRISELTRRYDASTTEIGAALAELAGRHLLRELADGRFYRSSPAEYLLALDGLPGLGTYLDPMGATMTCTDRHISRQPVPEDIRQALQLPETEPACSIQSTWTAGDTMAALTTTYLPAGLAAQLSPVQDALPGLSAVLTTVPPARRPDDGLPARPAAFCLEIQPPSRSAARRLRLAEGQPAITVSVRFEHPATGAPAALTVAVLRPDLFRITVTTTAAALPALAGPQPGQAGSAAAAGELPPGQTVPPAPAARPRLLNSNGVSLDLDGHRAFADGTEITLPRKEYDLLRVLLENAGRVVSRRELLDTIWRPGYADRNKTLEIHIRRLRAKLDPKSPAPRIRTVRGIGYIFDIETRQLTGG